MAKRGLPNLRGEKKGRSGSIEEAEHIMQKSLKNYYILTLKIGRGRRKLSCSS